MFSPLDVAHSSHVTPLPTILTLRNTQVHIGPAYCGDITSNIEISVDNFLGIGPILHVPDVQMLIHMIAMSDLGETLMTQGLDTRTTLLKMWFFLRIFSMSSEEMRVLVWSLR